MPSCEMCWMRRRVSHRVKTINSDVPPHRARAPSSIGAFLCLRPVQEQLEAPQQPASVTITPRTIKTKDT